MIPQGYDWRNSGWYKLAQVNSKPGYYVPERPMIAPPVPKYSVLAPGKVPTGDKTYVSIFRGAPGVLPEVPGAAYGTLPRNFGTQSGFVPGWGMGTVTGGPNASGATRKIGAPALLGETRPSVEQASDKPILAGFSTGLVSSLAAGLILFWFLRKRRLA